MHIQPSNLTEAQADGLACVLCGRDYLRSPGVAAVPLEVDGELLRGPSGSQLFVCSNTCESDVRAGEDPFRRSPKKVQDALADDLGPAGGQAYVACCCGRHVRADRHLGGGR